MGAFIKTIGLPFFFFVTFISVGHVFCIKQQMEILSERRKLLSGLQLRASAFTVIYTHQLEYGSFISNYYYRYI